jgi:hypothetical protein
MSMLQQEFAQAAARLIQRAAELGFDVTFGEAWRTPEQAQYNADRHIGVAHSLHMERLAIDLNLFKDGIYLSDDKTGAYSQLGEWWEAQGIDYRWGGRFKLVDLDHFSISPDGVRG